MAKKTVEVTTEEARPRRTRRSRDDIMARIVQAAAEEFNAAGYAETTTANIARRSGVTEAQLFRYFGSKANLFRETVFKPLAGHLSQFIDHHVPEDMAIPYTTDLQRFIRDNIGLFTSLVVVQTYGSGDAKGVGEIDSLREYFTRGAAALERWADADKLRVRPDLMVRVSFVAVLASIMFKDWIFPPGMASEEEITAAINDFVLDGIRAVKPDA